MDSTTRHQPSPKWMQTVLFAAATFSVIWGSWTMLFPQHYFSLVEIPAPNYMALWQGIGMSVVIFGLGYAIAATNPRQHWPIILLGFLAKIGGPLGFVWSVFQQKLPMAFGWAFLLNDVLWWIPFSFILATLYQLRLCEKETPENDLPTILEAAIDNEGQSLWERCWEQPVLLVFLRQKGCPFCREALADLRRQEHDITQRGVLPVLIHMSQEADMFELVDKFGMAHLPRISDPSQQLYQAFFLERCSFRQLVCPKIFWRAVKAGLFSGHGMGLLDGDGFQLPGAFILYRGQILKYFLHQTAADRVDFLQLVAETPLMCA